MSETKHTPGWSPTPQDMGDGISAAKRVNVVPSNWLEDWFIGHGKDVSCQIEGTANHWFWFAYLLLGLVEMGEQPYDEDKPLPHPPSLYQAAPDLLEALKEIRDYRGGADSALEDEYVMARVDAAIAKARGEG